MKKVLSVMAVSAFVLTAGVALAGGPGKKADGCPAACQQQIDDLNSSQAQQNEQLGADRKQLVNHEGRITTLEKNAYNPWYVRVGGKMTFSTQTGEFGYYNDSKVTADNEVGWGGQLAVGRQFGQFRTELEYAYQKADVKKFWQGSYVENDTTYYDNYDGDTSLHTVMINGYYEIPVADAFSVYGMVGLGYGQYNLKVKYNSTYPGDSGTVGDGSANAFAYKLGAGVSYAFTPEIAGDLGYEYLGVSDTTMNGVDYYSGYSSKIENIASHNVVASVRFKF